MLNIFDILKITVIIAICLVFMSAINALLSLISAVVFGSVVGEVIGIISCCLPFSASVVFGAIINVMAGILSFLIAKKIFDLTSWSISSI